MVELSSPFPAVVPPPTPEIPMPFSKKILRFILSVQTLVCLIFIVVFFILGRMYPQELADFPIYLTLYVAETLSAQCSWACIVLIFAAPLITYAYFNVVLTSIICLLGMLVAKILPPHRVNYKFLPLLFILTLVGIAAIRHMSYDSVPKTVIALLKIEQNYEHNAKTGDDDIYLSIDLQNIGSTVFNGPVSLHDNHIEGVRCSGDNSVLLHPNEQVTVRFSCYLYDDELKNSSLPLTIVFGKTIFRPVAQPRDIPITIQTIPDDIPFREQPKTAAPIPPLKPGTVDRSSVATPSLEFIPYTSSVLQAIYPVPVGWKKPSSVQGYYGQLREYRFENLSNESSVHFISIFSKPVESSLTAEEDLKKLHTDIFGLIANNDSYSYQQTQGRLFLIDQTIVRDPEKNGELRQERIYSRINTVGRSYYFIVGYRLRANSLEELQHDAELLVAYEKILEEFEVLE